MALMSWPLVRQNCAKVMVVHFPSVLTTWHHGWDFPEGVSFGSKIFWHYWHEESLPPLLFGKFSCTCILLSLLALIIFIISYDD